MKKMTLKEIGESVNKSAATVNGWKYRNIKMLEIVTLGAFCKKNNLDLKKITKMIELQDIIKDEK